MAKPALPLLDLPLVAFGLRRLYEAAPAVVFLNVRHLPRSVTAAVAPFVPTGGRLDTLHETPEAYGTAGTLVALRDRLTPTFLTWNSDLLTDLVATDLLATHERSGAPATIAVAEVTTGADFVVDGARAVGFVDRRDRTDAAGAVFLGAAVFERNALDPLPETRPLGLGETLLAALARSGELALHRHRGYWRDVGTIGAYLAASQDLLAGRGPEPPGGRWPGDLVETDGGRAYLGPSSSTAGASIGPGAVVLAGGVVRVGARVEHAIVWPGEVVPPGTLVKDGVWFRGRILSS